MSVISFMRADNYSEPDDSEFLPMRASGKDAYMARTWRGAPGGHHVNALNSLAFVAEEPEGLLIYKKK